jgi:hypothetical protein
LTRTQGELPFHLRGVTTEKCQLGEQHVQDWLIQLPGLPLLDDRPGLVKTIQSEVIKAQVLVTEYVVGIEPQGFLIFGQSLVMLAHISIVLERQQAIRQRVTRDKIARNTLNARKAYDTVLRLRNKVILTAEEELESDAGLAKLRADLVKLGEKPLIA